MKKLTALFAATAIALTAGLAQARDLGPDEALKLRDAGTIKSFEELNKNAIAKHPGSSVHDTELEEEYGRYIYQVELRDPQGVKWDWSWMPLPAPCSRTTRTTDEVAHALRRDRRTGPGGHQPRSDGARPRPDEVLRLRQDGVIQPLESLMQEALGRYPGARLLEVELEEEDDVYVYEVELLTRDGVVRELELDARNGRILKDEEDD